MQVSLQFDDFFWTKIFRNSNFNFNDPDYETFFGFYETRDRKGFLLGCSQFWSRILVLFQKGTKVTDDRYFGQGRVLLTKLKTGSWLVWHC